MITEKTIDACKNDEIKIAGDPPRPIKKGLMKVPHSISIIGAKGKGKTNCMVRLFRAYQKARVPAFDHDNVFIISPTAHLDPKAQLLSSPEENIYDSTEGLDMALRDIIEKIEDSLEEYEDYQDRMEAWAMFSSWDDPMSLFPADALLKIFNPVTQEIHKPTTNYIYGRPSSLIILDDQAGTGFLSDNTGNNALTNFIIKSRHYNTSVWITSQHYKNIGRAIRGNASCLIIFRTQDEKVLDEISREVGGDVDKKTFKKLYNHATAKPYNFLLIDLANDKHKFRRNFDRVLQV
tara:strand:+ start:1174 stop:2049 length:876 start_codon:yes stop_codon:yes gene_type:complete